MNIDFEAMAVLEEESQNVSVNNFLCYACLLLLDSIYELGSCFLLYVLKLLLYDDCYLRKMLKFYTSFCTDVINYL